MAAQPIAIVRGPTTVANLVGTIRSLFDKFYASSKDKPGLNIVFYPDWNNAGEFEIECGVQVEGGGNSATPAGTVATTVYLGFLQPNEACARSSRALVGGLRSLERRPR